MANQFNKSLLKDAKKEKELNDGDADFEETAGQEEQEEDVEPILDEEGDHYTSNEFLEHLSKNRKFSFQLARKTNVH